MVSSRVKQTGWNVVASWFKSREKDNQVVVEVAFSEGASKGYKSKEC